MPAMSELRTPPATQGAVISMWAQGTPKRKIARQLGIDKNTVASILKAYSQDKPDSVNRVPTLHPFAFDAVEKALKAGDARIGLDWLKATVLSQPTEHVTFNGDVSLTQAVQMLPPSTPSRTSTDSSASRPVLTSSTGTEAAEKAAGVDVSLPEHKNFLQTLSDEQLTEELERRRLTKIRTAELVECASK